MTTSKEQSLERLIERMKAATGADRELDCRIAYALDYEVDGMAAPFRSYCDVHDLKWGEIAHHATSPHSILRHNLPRFTASIDAALALVERVRPGNWRLMLMKALHEVNKAPDILDMSQMPRFIVLHLLQAIKEHSNDHE